MSNVVGTSHDRGSKKAFWEKHSGRYFGVCQVGGCVSRARVGADLNNSRHHKHFHQDLHCAPVPEM